MIGGASVSSNKIPKGMSYKVKINGWEPCHTVSIKSPLFDDPGYYESSSLKLYGNLINPENSSIKQAEIAFIEDRIGLHSAKRKPIDSVGEVLFNKEKNILEFTFFISSDFFSKVLLSMNSDRIDGFLAYGEKLNHNYASVFEFRLKPI